MDDSDRKLIALLRRDSRIPLCDLATRLGMARATVRARIEKLLAHGEIQGFTVLTRDDVAQSPVRGLMMLKIEGAGAERIRHRLMGFAQVTAVHSTNGNWDMIAEIGTGTLEAFDQVLFEIRQLDGVSSSETNLLLSTRKPAGTRQAASAG
ncbi:MAG: Lrp/AsnC family transcriptional regulator [Rhodobacteraceae bacterium]|nr:Lrp/AsnC family transcriptional regulator [Paracoccaceae bacterium]